jgi:hypothetical protein
LWQSFAVRHAFLLSAAIARSESQLGCAIHFVEAAWKLESLEGSGSPIKIE